MTRTYNLTFDQPGDKVLIYRNGSLITTVNSPTTTYADSGAADAGRPIYIAKAKTAGQIASLPRTVTATRHVITCDGDSITAGGSAPGSEYPTQLNAAIAGSFVKNLGGAGQTAAQRDAANATAAWVETSAIAVLWAGTNDVYFGATAAQTITNIVTWCTNVRAEGYRVVVVPIGPRSDGGTPVTFEADRQTVNTYLRANWASFADAFADTAANALIGAPGAQLNVLYFTDFVHMTGAGYSIAASIIEVQVRALLGI